MPDELDDRSLAEDQFQLVEEVEATMSPLHDRLLIRSISGIDPAYLNVLADELRERTSMTNPRGATCNYVTNPKVGDEGPGAGFKVYEGRWRGVSVRGTIQNGEGVITQTLAYGLVISPEGLPSPELVRTVDRLMTPHDPNASPEVAQKEVRYRGIDPSYVETLKDTISLVSGVVEARTVRMQDGSYNIHVLTETVTWTAFDSATPDFTFYHNRYTPHERKIEVWHGIAADDALANLYVPASGYNVMEVNITPGGNGSINIRRVQYLEALGVSGTELEADGYELLNAHGVETGAKYTVTIISEALMAKTDAYVTLSAAKTGYTKVASREQLRPDGLWNVYHIYEKVAWTNTTPASNNQVVRIVDPKDEARRTTHRATGIPVSTAKAATFLADLKTAIEVSDEVEDIRWVEVGEGQAQAEWVTLGEDEDDDEISKETQRNNATGNQTASVTHSWLWVSEDDMDTRYTTAAAYIGEDGDEDYVHKAHGRSYSRDGTGTVWAIAWDPSSQDASNITYWGPKDTTEYSHITRQSPFSPFMQWALVTRTFEYRYFASNTNALNHNDGGVEGSTTRKIGNTLIWESKKITSYSVGDWQAPPISYP